MLQYRFGLVKRLGDHRARAVGHLRRNTLLPPSERSKRKALRQVFRNHGHKLFVEAGTYLGDTVAYLLGDADRIVSVEIDPKLHETAVRRFANEPKVEIVRGDALEVIPSLVKDAGASALVYLDGHLSGAGTGQGELVEPAQAILERLGSAPPEADLTIVVDDVRLFGREPGFPSFERLFSTARGAFPGAQLWVENDALVIHSPAAGRENGAS